MLDTLAGNGKSHACTTDDYVDRDQRDDRGNLSWGGGAPAFEGRAWCAVGRREVRLGWPADGVPRWPFHQGSDVARWCRPEGISRMREGQAQPAMALRCMTTCPNCFCDRLYG